MSWYPAARQSQASLYSVSEQPGAQPMQGKVHLSELDEKKKKQASSLFSSLLSFFLKCWEAYIGFLIVPQTKVAYCYLFVFLA